MAAGIIIGTSIGIFALIVGATWWFGARAKERLAATYPPPGQMVDVGGYRMHIHCQGQEPENGAPTVVLDTGLGEPSLSWGSLPGKVAAFARVCTFDRAGLGWSESSPRPRTASHIVDEMHTLLARAQVAPPYVLVGHSIGGLYACVYAQRHPGEVAGLVLVDSAHEDQDTRPPEAMKTVGKLANKGAVSAFRFFRLLNSMGLLALMPGTVSKMWTGAIPDETRETTIGLACSGTRIFETMARETESSFDCLADIRSMQIRSLGDVPLIAVSRDPSEPAAVPGVSPEDAAQFEAVSQEMQAELAALSTRGKRVVAEGAGHYVHLRRPDAVIDAIREVLAAAQG